MCQPSFALYALNSSRGLGEEIAASLGATLSAHEEREFEDGEHKVRSLENVRNRDAFVVQSLYSDQQQTVNDKLIRLLFMIGALRDASAARVTAVIPYLAYGRKDKKSQPRDPVTTRYVASMFESAGCDRVVTLEVHNVAAFQNAFRIPTDHLESRKLFADHFATLFLDQERTGVVSPDLGGTKRAEAFREVLEKRTDVGVASGFMEKRRAHGVMTPGRLVGDVEGRTIVIFDDLISTGGTIVEAARRCKEHGAVAVYAAAAHGVFAGRAGQVLADEALDGVVVTDSIPAFRLDDETTRSKLTVLKSAPLLAESIRRIHTGDSLVELLSP
jgi:ribose-phosphate pyrophosphokinase